MVHVRAAPLRRMSARTEPPWHTDPGDSNQRVHGGLHKEHVLEWLLAADDCSARWVFQGAAAEKWGEMLKEVAFAIEPVLQIEMPSQGCAGAQVAPESDCHQGKCLNVYTSCGGLGPDSVDIEIQQEKIPETTSKSFSDGSRELAAEFHSVPSRASSNRSTDDNPVMVCESSGRSFVYPQHLMEHLKRTAPLPFFTALVGVCTGFYGLALVFFLLGLTSICYWWWPYTDNPWRKIDICCVGFVIVYCYTMSFDFDGASKTIWLACLSIVLATIIMNETIMYVMLQNADLKQKVQIWKRNLITHSFCAHITVNTLLSPFLIIYRFALDEPAIAFPQVFKGTS